MLEENGRTMLQRLLIKLVYTCWCFSSCLFSLSLQLLQCIHKCQGQVLAVMHGHCFANGMSPTARLAQLLIKGLLRNVQNANHWIEHICRGLYVKLYVSQ